MSKALKHIAVIADEFTELSLQGIGIIHPMTPTNWQTIFTDYDIDYLFVESAWQGHKKAWLNQLVHIDLKSSHIKKILDVCRHQNIPTLFWNKEDPLHFDAFIDLAKHFDIILTTDIQQIPHYKKHAPHAVIQCLPFFINPSITNPIGTFVHKAPDIAYAGRYYGTKKHTAFHQRGERLNELLDISTKSELTIYDRQKKYWFQTGSFPKQYRAFVKKALPYKILQKHYQQHAFWLNVDTITDSPTMCSRRLYEVQAAGSVVLSYPSKGLEQFAAFIKVTSGSEFNDIIKTLTDSKNAYVEQVRRQVCDIFLNHSHINRFIDLERKIDVQLGLSKTSVVWALQLESDPDSSALNSLKASIQSSTTHVFDWQSDATITTETTVDWVLTGTIQANFFRSNDLALKLYRLLSASQYVDEKITVIGLLKENQPAEMLYSDAQYSDLDPTVWLIKQTTYAQKKDMMDTLSEHENCFAC